MSVGRPAGRQTLFSVDQPCPRLIGPVDRINREFYCATRSTAPVDRSFATIDRAVDWVVPVHVTRTGQSGG